VLAEGDAGNALTEPQRTALDMAWRQFGAASSPAEFCQRWLELQCRIISGVQSAIVVLQKPGGEGFAPFAAWPEGRQDRALAEITERALREGRGLMQAAPQGANPDSLPDQPDYHLAYPVRLDGAVRGVVALAIGWREPAALQSAMRQLQWGSGWLEVLMRRHADPMEAARLRIKLILQLVAAFLERPDLEEAATDVATEIAARLGCERVVLGLAEGAQIRIAAVSHATQFDRRANLLNCISAAMLEALDQRETIAFPQDRDARPVVTLAHAELARVSGAGGIATVPLRHKGRQVGALAGQHLKRVHLELGGNSALIVLDDADLDAAAAAGAWGSFLHQGQICMTTGRHLVQDAIYDDYVAALAGKASHLPVGDPASGQVALGPLIDQRQRDKVHGLVTASVDAGARLAAGGTYEGLFYQPTVLAEVAPAMPAYASEVFGPVAPVIRFSTADEAAKLAADTEYGLSLGILTRDALRGLDLARKIPTGIVHINDQTVDDAPNTPFGGVFASGTGARFGGTANLDAFTDTRWVTMRADIAPYPF